MFEFWSLINSLHNTWHFYAMLSFDGWLLWCCWLVGWLVMFGVLAMLLPFICSPPYFGVQPFKQTRERVSGVKEQMVWEHEREHELTFVPDKSKRQTNYVVSRILRYSTHTHIQQHDGKWRNEKFKMTIYPFSSWWTDFELLLTNNNVLHIQNQDIPYIRMPC